MAELGDIAVNSIGDLILINSDIQVLNRRESVMQRVRIALLMVRGEWFRQRAVGVPWFTDILKKPIERVIADRTLRRAILSVPGVTSVERLALTENQNRQLVVTGLYRDRYSSTPQQIEVITP